VFGIEVSQIYENWQEMEGIQTNSEWKWLRTNWK